jgi:serine/threonine protein phosphatase PrpC
LLVVVVVVQFLGSSTACIVALHKEKRILHTANLGDSGFVVIRSNSIVHRSQEQQHYFNSPFQLAIHPTMQDSRFIADRYDNTNRRLVANLLFRCFLVELKQACSLLFCHSTVIGVANEIKKERERERESRRLDTSIDIVHVSVEFLLDFSSPDFASITAFNVEENDLIVIATDGLWDNLSDTTILEEIKQIQVGQFYR